jgi:hypothetical protein
MYTHTITVTVRTTQPRTVEGGLRPHPSKTGLRPEPNAEQLDCADQFYCEFKNILCFKISSFDSSYSFSLIEDRL